MTFRKFFILAGVALFSSAGDTILARGMKEVGEISLTNIFTVFHAVTNPWVMLGIVLLLGFFACYLTALSWADLTYVLPATSISYVLFVLFGKLFLHEQVTPIRWMGVLLIAGGVSFVSGSPLKTTEGVTVEIEVER